MNGSIKFRGLKTNETHKLRQFVATARRSRRARPRSSDFKVLTMDVAEIA
jgi:hypothetical protein